MLLSNRLICKEIYPERCRFRDVYHSGHEISEKHDISRILWISEDHLVNPVNLEPETSDVFADLVANLQVNVYISSLPSTNPLVLPVMETNLELNTSKGNILISMALLPS